MFFPANVMPCGQRFDREVFVRDNVDKKRSVLVQVVCGCGKEM